MTASPPHEPACCMGSPRAGPTMLRLCAVACGICTCHARLCSSNTSSMEAARHLGEGARGVIMERVAGGSGRQRGEVNACTQQRRLVQQLRLSTSRQHASFSGWLPQRAEPPAKMCTKQRLRFGGDSK